MKQDEVAERVSKRTAVTNSMRLLKLNEKVQQIMKCLPGHARALLGIENQDNSYSCTADTIRIKCT